MTLIEVDLHDLEEIPRGRMLSNPRYKYKILHIHKKLVLSLHEQKEKIMLF